MANVMVQARSVQIERLRVMVRMKERTKYQHRRINTLIRQQRETSH
jgi:hypothetical protein